jgi:hypothetical protein
MYVISLHFVSENKKSRYLSKIILKLLQCIQQADPFWNDWENVLYIQINYFKNRG